MFVNQGDPKAETSVVSTSKALSKYRIVTEKFSLELEEKQGLDSCRIVVVAEET